MSEKISSVLELPRMAAALKRQGRDDKYPLTYNCKVGVEIECEGVDAHHLQVLGGRVDDRVNQMWRIIRDGSLRGANFEAVFTKPLSGSNVSEALEVLQKAIDSNNMHPDFNCRTSVHVHVNVRDMTVSQLSTMVALYLIFEGALFNYVGEHRANSNYCTRLVGDMPTLAFLQSVCSDVAGIRKRALTGEVTFSADGEARRRFALSKYAALNLLAISNYGSVEFRHHPGEYDRDKIMRWINIILCLKGWAMENEVPPNMLIQQFSGVGAHSFMREVFGQLSEHLDYHGLEESMYEGARTIQSALVTARRNTFRRSSPRSPESLGQRIMTRINDEVESVILAAIKQAKDSIEDCTDEQLEHVLNNSDNEELIGNVFQERHRRLAEKKKAKKAKAKPFEEGVPAHIAELRDIAERAHARGRGAAWVNIDEDFQPVPRRG